jgi:hypothetical protein
MKQHIVSKCYLKAWCDPSTPPGHEPFVWLISRDGAKKARRAPHKSLTKSDAYTITFKDGSSDLRVETTLSQLEAKFVKVQRRISERKPIDLHERAYLAAFMATMYSRTDPFAEGMKEAWSKVDDLVRKVEDVIKRGDASQLSGSIMPGEGQPISSEQTQYLIENARPLGVEAAFEITAPIIWGMSLAFMQAPKGSFFVTSDNPCVWFSPSAYRMPPFYRGVGLAMKDIEITMPVTPEILALVTHYPRATGYLNLTDAHVQELNRRTVGFCDKQFVSRSPETMPSWFDPGTPPPDAWESRVKGDESAPRRPFEE